MTAPAVLIAQISDLHIKPRGMKAYQVVDTAGALARCISFLNAMRPAPAVVVCSGDLVDGGTSAEYEHLKELIAPLTIPFAAIPGNHDAREPMRAAFPHQAYCSGMNLLVQAGPIDLVLLDSSVPGKAHGLLAAESLAWLKTVLARSARPAILFVHHPPFRTGISHMDVQNLHNADALAAVISRHPRVLQVAAGHIHRSIFTSFAHVPATICPAPNHVVDLDLIGENPPSLRLEPPGLHLHAWFDEGRFGRLVTHFVPIGEFDGPYPFFDKAGASL
jgi:3',5'-cyclic-AMP phosphodiesterase